MCLQGSFHLFFALKQRTKVQDCFPFFTLNGLQKTDRNQLTSFKQFRSDALLTPFFAKSKKVTTPKPYKKEPKPSTFPSNKRG